MALEKRQALGLYRARLRQVEDGVYRADYAGKLNAKDPDERKIPDYHLGPAPGT